MIRRKNCIHNERQVCKDLNWLSSIDMDLERDRFEEVDTQLGILKEFIEAIDQKGERWE